MHRSYLLLLFIFLFSHFVANAQSVKLEIEAVSVDTMSQLITLTWELNPEVEDVIIYGCTTDCSIQNNYHVIDTVSMSHLKWIDLDADSSSALHYYCIGGLNSAGGPISGKSAPKTNMVLKADLPAGGCLNSILLSWNPYIRYVDFSWNQSSINRMDTLDYYIFYREKNINAPFMLLDSITGTHFTDMNSTIDIHYEAKYLENNMLYEFVVQAISKIDTVRPFSNIAEHETGFVINDSVLVTITCVSVKEDRYIEIDVVTDDFPEPFQKLYLLRDKPDKEFWIKDSLSFKIIDSMEYSSTNKYRFIDEDVDPGSGLYYYMAVADNKCKLNDTSNVLTNIYLYGRRVDKYADSISFSREGIPFLDSEWYELFRIVYEKEISITNMLTILNRGYYIDVTPFMNDGAAIKYQIRSDDGCYSNTLIIEHEPYTEFPNAFYPQSINVENRTFYPILKFPSEDNYLFIIYNRWGQEVYRSTLPPIYGDYGNPQGRWDGTFQGKDCPQGIYAFRISYSYNGGLGKYSDTGSVMLVR